MDPYLLIKNNDISLFKDYLKGHDIDEINNLGESFLNYSIKNNSIVISNLLINMGIDVNIKDIYGNTALNLAIVFNKIGLVRQLLLTPSINKDSTDINNNTPLMLAYKNNREEIIELLRNLKVDTKGINKFEENIYFQAVRGKNVKSLNDIGYITDKYKRNVFGDTMLHVAVKGGDYATTKYLLDLGIYVDSLNKDLETPLFEAIRTNNLNIINLLLEYGALLEYKNVFEESLLLINSKFKKYILEYSLNPTYMSYKTNFKDHYLIRINQQETMIRKVTGYKERLKDNFGKTYPDYIDIISKSKIKNKYKA